MQFRPTALMKVDPISDTESGSVTLERPDASQNSRDDWVEAIEPFRQFGKFLEGSVRCYFYDELMELRGDADEIHISSVSYNVKDGVKIEYERYWYEP